MKEYALLVAGWLLYYGSHSVLATDRIKKVFAKKIYRPLYVLVSVAGLMVMLLLNGSIEAMPFFKTEGPMRYASLLLTTFGVMIIHASFRQYSFSGFVGLKDEPVEMKTDGILQQVRHPVYSGTILIVLGFFLYIPNLPTLVSCVCTFAYLPIGMNLEEKKLIKQFGEQYLDYKKRVPAIVPKLQ